MLNRLREWREQRILKQHPIDETLWTEGLQALPMLQRLDAEELRRLRRLTTLFLHQKRFLGAGGLEVAPAMALDIALQACLPILNLGLDWYEDWVTIIVYPDDFLAEHEYTDEHGVVHVERGPRSGEAWDQGPVLLSWAEVAQGEGLVLHEFAHTLDMRNGQANGMPPLHADMSREHWAQVMSAAFEALNAAVERGEESGIDPYAATDPAEFFAVTSEYFFAEPQTLWRVFPQVYEQFARFYHQDPMAAYLSA
ncbi:zinc-dependent peptidase [Thioalkalivibrio sulfidiphilus]|uniref:M90 family metallopeptidase n=1 Tax=Thioalkalivibrio sulfidiphilus TaxID=1033854 RepID=UPI003B2CD84A